MGIDSSKIKALCFDVDGTLRDTDDHYVAKFGNYFSKIMPQEKANIWARRLVMRLDTPTNLIYQVVDWMTIDDEIFSVLDWLHAKGIMKENKLPTRFLIIIKYWLIFELLAYSL